MRMRDWFTVSAVASPLAMLFVFYFGLFTRAAMSPLSECLWIVGALGVAALTWLSMAKAQKNEREAREHARESKERELKADNKLDTLIRLVSKPETTLADVKMAIDQFMPMRQITSPALWDYQSRHNQARPNIDPNTPESK